MARTRPFSSLPYEIVSQICRQPDLDKDDLIALRLTCKSYGIHDAAITSLGKLFEDITVLFSGHSFNMLINICKHPVFSHRIRSVKLSSIRCNTHESLQTTINSLRLGDSLSNHSAGLDARLQALDDLSARIRSYALRTRHESDLSRSNKPVELLTLAFKCLSRSGNRIALGIAIHETNGLGCGRVLCAKDVFSNLWYNAIYSTLEVLATAVSNANYSFGKLNIDTRAMDSLVAEVLFRPTQIKELRVLGADTPGWKWSAYNLISKICSDLGLQKKDLIALRLTSKSQSIHASATKAFGKLCFTTVPILYNRESLRTFVKICQHTIFGRCIRKTELSCARFDREGFDEYMPIVSFIQNDRHKYLKEVQSIVDRCDADEFFDPKPLLNRGFGHLAGSAHNFTIVVSTDESQSLGQSKVFRSQKGSGYWSADPTPILNLLLEAANAHGCKIQSVNITTEAVFYDRSSTYYVAEVVPSVSNLRFDMALNNDDIYDEFDIGGPLWLMKRVLLQAFNLKVLHIRTNIGHDNDFAALEQPISLLPLNELRLSGVEIYDTTLAAILQSLRKTLRCLGICRCDIYGSWKQALLRLQQHTLQLDDLHISGSKRI
ncbi:hypothetical protein KCU83_g8797, partial [Aureobasidium melanogenum]